MGHSEKRIGGREEKVRLTGQAHVEQLRRSYIKATAAPEINAPSKAHTSCHYAWRRPAHLPSQTFGSVY